MKSYSLLIKPTSADCNIACHYCFYAEKKSLYPATQRHRMSYELLESMIANYMSEPMSEYVFSWQGGEPTLMGVDFFREAVRLQIKYGHRGTRITNTLQTNGILLNSEFAAFLAEYNFLVGVSLDGDASLHNIYRRTYGNKGTHAKVVKGINCLRKVGGAYNVLSVINRVSVKNPQLLYQYLVGSGYNYLQFIPCVEFENDGRATDFSVEPKDWGEFLLAIFDLWYAHDRDNVSIRFFDTVLNYLISARRNACTIGTDCRKYFVVEYNGDIFPCDFYVTPQTRLGNTLTQKFSELYASDAYAAFGARKRDLAESCRICSYREICQGDCPRNRVVADNEIISYLCAGWKIFFDGAIERLRELAAYSKQVR